MIVNTVEIDGKEYDELDVITINDTKYAYLSSINDELDILIQIIVTKNDEEYYEALDSKEEFENALKEFYKKHKDIIKN